VVFSPEGTLLATTSDDQTVRLWAAPIIWIDQACKLVGRNLSQAEWDEHIGAGRPYVRQCEQFPAGPGAPVDAPVARYPAASSEPGRERLHHSLGAGRGIMMHLSLA
jgi:hypothetical protein